MNDGAATGTEAGATEAEAVAAAEPRWLDGTEMRAWRGYLHLTWLLGAAIERDLLRDSGLSHADYYVLVELSEAPGHAVRMSDLAGGIRWSKSRLSHQISRMEARGLVSRRECASDARGTFATLTPAGLEAITRAAPRHVESIRRRLLDRLDHEQVEALAAICDTVVSSLADGDEAPACVRDPSPPCPQEPPSTGRTAPVIAAASSPQR